MKQFLFQFILIIKSIMILRIIIITTLIIRTVRRTIIKVIAIVLTDGND